MRNIYTIPDREFKEDKKATNLALSFLSPNAIRVWMNGITGDFGKIQQLNSDFFLEESNLSKDEIEESIQELKNKKYILPIDEEAGVWKIYAYPQIKGVFDNGK
jgi:hypothetical protein